MHRRLFARLEQVDRVVTLLNLLLLGLIGLTPFVAKMVAEAGPQRALPFYLVALASVFASLTLIRLWPSSVRLCSMLTSIGPGGATSCSIKLPLRSDWAD